jgi:hypothetical protein
MKTCENHRLEPAENSGWGIIAAYHPRAEIRALARFVIENSAYCPQEVSHSGENS